MDTSSLIDRESRFSEEEVKKFIKAKLENRISSLPYGFWRCREGKEHSKIAIKYLIEEHLQLELEDVPKKISASTFHEVGLFRLLVEYFDASYFKALDYTYPGKFKPWEFTKGMTGIWNGEDGRKRSLEAIKYLIRELEIPFDDIPRKINYETFKQFGLGGMLQTLYNSSPYQAINALFPEKFKPWEFSVKNFWKERTLENARMATRWLIEEKLQFPDEKILQVRRKDFLYYNLGPMLKVFYQNSHLKAVYDAYPNVL